MAISRVLQETKYAYLRYDPEGDEFAIDQKPPNAGGRDDPIAFGFGVHRQGTGEQYLCKIRFDLLSETDGTRRQELGFLAVKIDVTGHLFFEVYLDDQRRLELRPEAFDRLMALLAGASPVSGAAPTRFASDDGRYIYNVQGDPTPEYPHGRIVQYDTRQVDANGNLTPVAILKPSPL